MHFITLNRLKFAFRTTILLCAVVLAVVDYTLLTRLFYMEVISIGGLTIQVFHILWALLMLGMIQVCIPGLNNYISCGKLFEKHYRATGEAVSKENFDLEVTKNNIGAIRSGVFWAVIMMMVAGLYYFGIIDKVGLVLVSVFFYFSDQFCINIWCPFREWLVKNKCCNACRIYNWGHFMIVSPLIFIPSFWSISLLVVSLLILLQWELQHYRYPERFIELTNDNLKCAKCMKAKCGYIKP